MLNPKHFMPKKKNLILQKTNKSIYKLSKNDFLFGMEIGKKIKCRTQKCGLFINNSKK